jgi:hypothetical protein
MGPYAGQALTKTSLYADFRADSNTCTMRNPMPALTLFQSRIYVPVRVGLCSHLKSRPNINSIRHRKARFVAQIVTKTHYNLYRLRLTIWPERVFVNLLRGPVIDSQPGGPVRQLYLPYRQPGYLGGESIPGLLKRLQIRAQD